jgi:orsellinic acid/F9775 biosynthesis protein OrsD
MVPPDMTVRRAVIVAFWSKSGDCVLGARDRFLTDHAKACDGTGRDPPAAAAAAEATAGSDAPPLSRSPAMRSGVPRDCTDADGLAELGLLVNTQAKIIICSACGYAVGADHLATHMRTRHTLVRLPSGFGHQLVEKYGVKRLPERPPVHDGEPGMAIRGLPTYAGFRCAMCAYFCKKKASMLAHVRRDHGGQGGRRREDTEGEGGPSPPPPSMTPCRVQTIFSGLFTRYFGVRDDDDGGRDQERDRSLWLILKRQIDEKERRAAAAAAAAAGGLPDNRRLWDPFISRTRWDLMLREEHSEDDHVRFAALPRRDEGRGLNMLRRMALSYIHLVSEEISVGQVSLRRKMMALSE